MLAIALRKQQKLLSGSIFGKTANTRRRARELPCAPACTGLGYQPVIRFKKGIMRSIARAGQSSGTM